MWSANAGTRAEAVARAQTLRAVVMALAKKTAKAGFSTADVPGWNCNRVNDACRWLSDNGKLFKATTGHRTVRYFDLEADRDEFMRVHSGARAVGVTIGPRARAPWPKDAPGVETKQTVYTVCPGFAFRSGGNPPRTNTYAVI